MRNNNGFTLVELIVVMAIFIGVIMISTYAFEHILSKAGQQIRSAESQTEGIVGLEMLRADLEHIGFGLPWTIPTPPASPGYNETTVTPVTGMTMADFLDITAPRAVQVASAPSGSKMIDSPGTNNSNPGTAYLVIKSSRVAVHDTAKKWAYVNYSSGNNSYVKLWGDQDFNAGDRVITLNTTFASDGTPDKRLVMNGPNYSYTMPTVDIAYMPGDSSQLYVVYGVDPGSDLRMPYNRADYYVKKPANMPAHCNPGTGILYKGVVNQASGDYVGSDYALLNCVGDMQVGFGFDTGGYANTLVGMTAADIRNHLKTVSVYILAHEGKKDRNYSYPPIDSTNAIFVGPYIGSTPSSVEGRMLTQANMATYFGADWKNYRWKVYTIVGRTKNLNN